MNYSYGSFLQHRSWCIYKYCPKPSHSNLNMFISVRNKECGVICGPEHALLYSVLKCFLKVYCVHLWRFPACLIYYQSPQETYFSKVCKSLLWNLSWIVMLFQHEDILWPHSELVTECAVVAASETGPLNITVVLWVHYLSARLPSPWQPRLWLLIAGGWQATQTV